MSISAVIANTFTAIFLIVILSYYALFIVPAKKSKKVAGSSITVIIPAHNEERYIAAAIKSVQDASWVGKKTIVVVDDGSKDRTYTIAKQFPVTIYKRPHSGKSATINFAIAKTRSDYIAIVDGDSEIHADALIESAKRFHSKNVAAVCAVIKVKNRNSPLGFWLHIEQLYSSLTRSLFAKVNVNIVAAGPLSVFRRIALKSIGNFRTEGYSEDADVAIRLLKAGWRIEYAEKAITETNMPVSWKWFVRQRSRFAKGTVNILKRHLSLDHTMVRIYTLPLLFFSYMQAVIMGLITLVNLGIGYYTYFISKGVWLNWGVVRYFIEWLSIVGVVRWAWSLLSGTTPFTIAAAIGLAATLLSYPLYILAIVRYDKSFNLAHFVAVSLLFPFWIIVMTIYLLNIGEWIRKDQFNRWEKERA